ncbi:hypothetical protein LguiB_035460 [Lonicera macranthoides]
MEGESNNGSSSNGEKRVNRFPLSEVVSDCVHRWFQDTLKEAKAGDISMQVLVAQMYFNGYGVPIDEQKVPILGFVPVAHLIVPLKRNLSSRLNYKLQIHLDEPTGALGLTIEIPPRVGRDTS